MESKKFFNSVIVNAISISVIIVSLLFSVFSASKIANLGQFAPESESQDLSALYAFSFFGKTGYSGLSSSVLWVYSVFKYADGLFETHHVVGLNKFIEAVNALDPDWKYPFEFGGLVFQGEMGTDYKDAQIILRDGIRHHPGYWKFRVYLAMNMLDHKAPSDSIANVLLPISTGGETVPIYARTLAFTILAKDGDSKHAMDLLLQAYSQIPDPLIRYSFQNKIGDLLARSGVKLGADSIPFINGVGLMLDSKRIDQIDAAKATLFQLMVPQERAKGLEMVKHFANQFREYKASQASH